MRQNILYKIYIGHKCVYIDSTTGDLTATLRMRFFGTDDPIDVTRVSKIEYVVLPSQADCIVYKTYLVNKQKPLYNRSNKARDVLSENIELPELDFIEYNNPIIDKWKQMASMDQMDLFENTI